MTGYVDHALASTRTAYGSTPTPDTGPTYVCLGCGRFRLHSEPR